MTGDKFILTRFVKRADLCVIFEYDNKCHTTRHCLIFMENVIIEHVALVDDLTHNLLSISQLLCDNENNMLELKHVS